MPKLVPLSLEDARRIVGRFVEDYNEQRLHSALGYVTPRDRLEPRHDQIYAERDRKLALAREQQGQRRRQERDRAGTRSPEENPTEAAPQRIDFARLRSECQITEVLNLLGFQPLSQRGAQQRGACPLHGSTSGIARCFSVTVERQVLHCLKCERSGNALDLWSAATRQTPYQAALEICRRLGREVPYLPPLPTEKRHPFPLPGDRV